MNAWAAALALAVEAQHTAPPRVLVRSGRSVGRPDPADLAILSPDERARAQRFRHAYRAGAYTASHAAVRRCLAENLSWPAEEIRFGRRPCPGCGRAGHGRPVIELPQTAWESSLSRSGPYWLVAAVDGVRVGVDIERFRPVDLKTLSAAVLSEAERGYLAQLAPELRQRAFIRCWTRKEAVVKASGIGIEADLRQMEVRPWEWTALVEHEVTGCAINTWAVHDLPGGADHSTSLALPAEIGPVVISGPDDLPASPIDIV